MREREVTSLELVELSLARIERLDPALNAFVTVCEDEALAEARHVVADVDEDGLVEALDLALAAP